MSGKFWTHTLILTNITLLYNLKPIEFLFTLHALTLRSVRIITVREQIIYQDLFHFTG
jgi:hypothetical protein